MVKFAPVDNMFPPVGRSNHSKVPVPLTLNEVVCPAQRVRLAEGVVLVGAAGVVLTVTVICVLAEAQPLFALMWLTQYDLVAGKLSVGKVTELPVANEVIAVCDDHHAVVVLAGGAVTERVVPLPWQIDRLAAGVLLTGAAGGCMAVTEINNRGDAQLPIPLCT